jgi:hypothetical protein
VELADEFERGMALLRSSVAGEGEMLEKNVLSLTSSDPAGSALQALSLDEQEMAEEGEEFKKTKPSQHSPTALRMMSLWSAPRVV